VEAYLLLAAAVFGINLLPAFGPPTWAVLVLFHLNGDYWLPGLVLVGAVCAASGRLVLALVTRRVGKRLPERWRTNAEAAGERLAENRGRSLAGLALFAVSPVPSAQLFEAAGLMSVRLLPLTAAFFAGRTVSYTVYSKTADTLSETDTGETLLANITSPWGVALQVTMLVGIVLLGRVDWRPKGDRAGTSPA
jgi:membrane protein YqaA with SNARE-associated domain